MNNISSVNVLGTAHEEQKVRPISYVKLQALLKSLRDSVVIG